MMWKPKVRQDRVTGRWYLVGTPGRFRAWRDAYQAALCAAGRFAGREVPC